MKISSTSILTLISFAVCWGYNGQVTAQLRPVALVAKAILVDDSTCGADIYGNDETSYVCREVIAAIDVATFSSLYNGGSFRADVNGDGFVNATDQQLFNASLANHDNRVVKINTNLGPSFAVAFTPLEAYRNAYQNQSLNPTSLEQWTFLSANPCYNYANLAGTRHGKANIFVKGPLDFSTTTFNEPVLASSFQFIRPSPVCMNNLGVFNAETGVRTADNDGWLSGLYHEVQIGDMDPIIGRFRNRNNDFRIAWPSLDENITRAAYNAATQVHAYYFYNDYRNRVLTPDVLTQLNLSPQIDRNLRWRQFRYDMPQPPPNSNSEPLRLGKMITKPGEVTTPAFLMLELFSNKYYASFVSTFNMYYKPHSTLFNPDTSMADGLGLVAQWILGVSENFPGDQTYSANPFPNVLPAVNDATFDWSSYRYLSLLHNQKTSRLVTSHTQGMLFFNRMHQQLPCGSNASSIVYPNCDAGENINNVMTMDEVRGLNTSSTNAFWPFPGAGYGHLMGQFTGADLGGTFIASIFYNLAHRAGLGIERADKLLWKTISLINRTDKMPMRRFGQLIQKAARSLYPMSGNPSVSVYEEVVRHTLLTKGIAVDSTFYCSDLPVISGANDDYACCSAPNGPEPECAAAKAITGSNGATVFTQLPLPVGYNNQSAFEASTTTYVGGLLPDNHPVLTAFTGVTWGRNGYTHPSAVSNYVAYTFLKNSQHGPDDKFILTNDTRAATFTNMNTANFTCADSIANGYKCYEFMGEELDNKTVFMPGNRLRFARQLRRAVNNRAATYVEDTAPIGTRAVQAVSDGFSFSVARNNSSGATANYTLSVVDPSYNSGTDTYSWQITRFATTSSGGAVQQVLNPANGLSTQVTLYLDQPAIISLTRTRNGVPTTLRIVDRGTDLDRSAGSQFVKSML